MIDIRVIRENPEKIQEKMKRRNVNPDFAKLLEWDKKRRALLGNVEQMKKERNVTSKQISVMQKNKEDTETVMVKMKHLSEEIAGLDREISRLGEKIQSFLECLPNIPAEGVASGGKENNETDHVWGKKPVFDFEPKDHVELCKSLHLIDYERGIKLSGQGSWIYTGKGAQLEWALISFFIREHLKNGYEFLMPPYMLGYQCGYVAGQFPKYVEEDYWIDGGPDRKGKFLLPTAETALVNYHRDEIMDISGFPYRYFAYTPCFRREAGSSRLEERGMVRGHQFNKVELVHYAHPDHSEESFISLCETAENLMQQLGLHYRLNRLAAADCAFSMAKTYDVEVWIPSMDIYKEVSSVSHGYDYQSRRGNIRFKDADNKTRYVHTLNASGLATSRLIPAIVEQFQQADGSVVIPEVLRRDMGADIISVP